MFLITIWGICQRICDSVINGGQTGCIWIANPSHLYRCWSACHCSQLIVSCMSSKFHQNINFILPNHTSNLLFINPIYIPPHPPLFQDSLPKLVCFCIRLYNS
uniref:Putative UDP-N-acetylglucosaminepeptide N-acetylglucosaminyltransferase SPINDLY isoform X1 n=1 Tax=Rhizophora mucronata TaxID=61149 RepID=A0A2P2KK85_RHIMU